MIHFAKHTQLFIHLFIHLSKFLMNSIWCRVEDIYAQPTKYYYCRMKNYKIVFIKFDEIILIGFVIDIKLMFFAWNFLSAFLLFCGRGFSGWNGNVDNKMCPNVLQTSTNKMRYTFRLPWGAKIYLYSKCVSIFFVYLQREDFDV